MMNICKSVVWKSNRFLKKASCRAFMLSSACMKTSVNLEEFSPEKIRNFGIIAHVDHGKSTIADRLLEFTGTISRSKENKQVLDKLQVERERGITVKAQTATMIYKHENQEYLFNLIDTPGHVDFSYEVSRSLSACQGVLLVVDAAQGIQAQTLANFYLAMEHEVQIIPVINKIDLKTSNIERVKQELEKLMDIDPSDVLCVSAKLGTNIEDILKAIVQRLPSPKEADPTSYDRNEQLKALLFDSNYENHKGVIANVLVINGILQKGDKITSQWLNERDDKGKKSYDVKEVGLLRPDNYPVDVLYAGQVGYMACAMKKPSEAQIGDTFFRPDFPVTPLPGFKKAKPVVFGGMYPIDQTQHKDLEAALTRLTLNDRSVSIEPSNSTVLGAGFRVGFLGLLHMDVFQQRLQQEFNATVVMTSPSVVYKATLKATKKNSKDPEEILIRTPSDFPDQTKVAEYFQPMIMATILTPSQFEAEVSNLCMERDGVEMSNSAINETRLMLQYRMPMSEVIVDFYDKLKSLTSGYARRLIEKAHDHSVLPHLILFSFDYDEIGYESTELVKLEFLLNGTVIEELSNICPAKKARYLGGRMCERLKELLPRQLYALAIQAVVGKTVLARENLGAVKKDVLVNCSGGDYTRKLKLLRRHAKQQKSLKEHGSIKIPKTLFLDILK